MLLFESQKVTQKLLAKFNSSIFLCRSSVDTRTEISPIFGFAKIRQRHHQKNSLLNLYRTVCSVSPCGERV